MRYNRYEREQERQNNNLLFGAASLLGLAATVAIAAGFSSAAAGKPFRTEECIPGSNQYYNSVEFNVGDHKVCAYDDASLFSRPDKHTDELKVTLPNGTSWRVQRGEAGYDKHFTEADRIFKERF